MPLASIHAYRDPEQLEAAYTATKVELTPTRPGPFSADVVRLELDRLWMQRVHESAPRIKWAAQSPDRAFFRFLTKPGAELIMDGIALRSGELMRHSRAHSYYEHSSSAVNWAAVSLPVVNLATTASVMAGCDLSPPSEALHVTPAAHAMIRLERLHAEAGRIARESAHLIARPEVVRALEQSLIEALVGCLESQSRQSRTWAQQCHETIMHRFHKLLDDAPDRAAYLPEICAAIRVPERTLRLCCHEHLGVSPKHYLMLRRMNLVRRTLIVSQPAEKTVTEVATRFGFWHLGRFAMTFRSLFGEAPHTTLARPP